MRTRAVGALLLVVSLVSFYLIEENTGLMMNWRGGLTSLAVLVYWAPMFSAIMAMISGDEIAALMTFFGSLATSMAISLGAGDYLVMVMLFLISSLFVPTIYGIERQSRLGTLTV